MGPGAGPVPKSRDLLVALNLRFRLAFLHVLKAAGRTWLRYLDHLGGWEWTSLHAILRNASLPSLFFFGFVREPTARFFSGYQEATRTQYMAPLDVSRGRCPGHPLQPPWWYRKSGQSRRLCDVHAAKLRHTGYARVPLSSASEDLDGGRLARLRFQLYVRHQARATGGGALLGEEHTLSQVNFLIGSSPDGKEPWAPDFVGRLERLREDAEELVRRAAARLPSRLARELRRRHANHAEKLLGGHGHPDFLGSRAHAPVHRPAEFYLEAAAADPGTCLDFCTALLQDAVCLGYELPSICGSCGGAGGQAGGEEELHGLLLLNRSWVFGAGWRRRHRAENCRFFRKRPEWGQQSVVYCQRM